MDHKTEIGRTPYAMAYELPLGFKNMQPPMLSAQMIRVAHPNLSHGPRNVRASNSEEAMHWTQMATAAMDKHGGYTWLSQDRFDSATEIVTAANSEKQDQRKDYINVLIHLYDTYWVASCGFHETELLGPCVAPGQDYFHVHDLETCLSSLHTPRTEYIKSGTPLAVTVSDSWQIDSDGNAILPFVEVTKYPSIEFSKMDGNDLAANNIYLAAPPQLLALGVQNGAAAGFGPYEAGSIKLNQWEKHVAGGLVGVDANMWTTYNNVNMKESTAAGEVSLAEQHRREYLSMYVEGRGKDTGDHMLMHCSFAESNTLGPTK